MYCTTVFRVVEFPVQGGGGGGGGSVGENIVVTMHKVWTRKGKI